MKRGKNDAADAEALCEAMSRPTMRFVPVKSAEQQAALMLVGIRERAVAARTRLANTIRACAAEFGVTAAKGVSHIPRLLESIMADENIPALAHDLFASLADEFAQLRERLEETEASLMIWYRRNECCRPLAKIPGVGPIGAVLLEMKAPALEQFASGRQFATWVCPTLRDHSTAGKVRPGVITRAGDEALRKTLVVGAISLLRQVRAGRGRNASPWLIDLLKRKPPKLAAVALANKIARIAWKMMMSGAAYKNTAARPAQRTTLPEKGSPLKSLM